MLDAAHFAERQLDFGESLLEVTIDVPLVLIGSAVSDNACLKREGRILGGKPLDRRS